MTERAGSESSMSWRTLLLTMPMRLRRPIQSESPKVSPRTEIVPEEGVRRPVRQLRREVLPEPLGPRMVQNWPGRICHERLRRTGVPWRETESLRTSRMGVMRRAVCVR
jgi:hypothetical protein